MDNEVTAKMEPEGQRRPFKVWFLEWMAYLFRWESGFGNLLGRPGKKGRRGYYRACSGGHHH